MRNPKQPTETSLRVRRKKSLANMGFKRGFLFFSFSALLILKSVQASESETLDLETYNAQLLDTLSAEQYSNNEPPNQDYIDYSEVDDGLSISVVSSTSSAISLEEPTTPMPSFPDRAPPRPRSDKSSQTSWGNFEEMSNNVGINDPELDAVFPQFAEAYNQEEGQLQADLADLDFVDQSDFAILNVDGSIESFGNADDLGNIVYDDAYEVYEDYDEQPRENIDPGFDLGHGNAGPTTLMLFNIFSPEEVDFLTTLVGEDAIKELKDDVDAPDEIGSDQLRQTLEVNTPKSRRPPQFDEEESKNVYPSSQGIVRPDSNIRESLQVYHKSELQHQDQAGDLGEEGIEKSPYDQPAASIVTYAPQVSSAPNHGLIAKADQRREKMEALLEKLSERYEKRTQKPDVMDQEDVLDAAIKETDEKTDRMKTMIDNLKHKLANSRPGVNTIDTKTLAEPVVQRNQNEEIQYYHTTAKPVHIDKVSAMIGERLRDMQVGIHTLNLDDMLDLDNIQIKNKGEDSNPSPHYPELPVGPPGSPDNKPKRQVLHPKLTRQRPTLGKAHIPSINLKSHITPATEAPNLAAVEYKERPIIPRYVDETIPTPLPFTYPSEDDPKAKTKVKFLPPRQGPRLKGYKKNPDLHPETKELDPRDHYPVFETDYSGYEDKTEKSDSLPPTLFYSDSHVPENFNPKVGPHPVPPNAPVPPHIDSASVDEHHDYHNKYVPSNTYRQNGEGAPNSERTSKEYAPSTFTKFPPPSYNYKQPNIRFDETPTKSPEIQVTPKNLPVTTPQPSSGYSVHSLKTHAPKQLPTRSYAAPPYRPPSYHPTNVPDFYTQPPEYNEHPGNPKAEHISSLSPPARGYVPAVGQRTTVAPPQKPYHSPRPSYMSKMYPPRSGYVPPSSGNYISTMSPPSHGYSTPAPHVSSIAPPHSGYLPPKSVSTLSPPTSTYHSTPKSPHVSSISPPKYGYSTPKPYGGMELPKDDYHKPVQSYISTMTPPKLGYDSHFSTMKPPKHGYDSHLSTMAPPSDQYKPPNYIASMKPPTHVYENPKHHSMTTMKPPSESYASGIKNHLGKIPPPGKEYLPPKNEMTKYTPPTGDFTALQPNYREAIKPPKSAYEEGMKNIMSKLSLPEQEFLEHAMSGRTYLPPKKEYKAPKHLTHEHPPSTDYVETMFKHHLQDMEAPTKDYLPPKQSYLEPPKGSYDSPINDYLSSMHLPRKGYLPPDEPSTYKPPSKDYNEAMSEYLGTLQAPDSGYLPPEPKGSHMKPPASSYEKPLADYMSRLHAPDKGYLPPKEVQGVLPKLASYLSPISEYMASMLPPNTDYKQPASMKPPTKDYVAPHSNHGSKLKPPSREYLTPFKPENIKDPRLLALFPPVNGYSSGPVIPQPRPYARYVCPPADKDVKCEYVKHQCWSPGQSDVDCPGEGLCCFNGCVNICVPPPPPSAAKLPISSFFHIPPNSAYLVPGKDNLYLQTLSSKRRNEEGTDALSEYFLPPMYSLAALDTVEISGLPNRPEVSQLPRDKPEKANLIPPIKEYLPPPSEYQLPEDGYTYPDYAGADVSDILRPVTSYAPPTVRYQVSHEHVDLNGGLELPGKEYLPPNKITKYSPPASDYKVPKSLGVFVPPSNEYLPPDNMHKYKPPSEAYAPPEAITKYKPPSQEYLAPKEKLKPPTDDYLPPPSSTLSPVLIPVDATFLPPSEEYLDPAYRKSKVPMVPPSEPFYYNPNAGPGQGALFSPPSKEYIPPALAVSDPYDSEAKKGALLTPPNKQYLPPSYAVEDTLLEGVSFRPPSKEYLPPASPTPLPGKPAHLLPPSKEYIPPGEYHAAPEHHLVHAGEAHFHPPTKEYLPPKTVVSPNGATFAPPAADYVAPVVGNHLDAVHNIDMTYKPPTKEYLPPAAAHGKPKLPPPPHPSEIPFGDLPTLVPPSKDYLPPPSTAIEEIGHAIHVSEHHKPHVTVPPVLLPKPDHDYHVTATINHDGHIEPHHGVVTKHGPHSINIQINIPDKEKPHHVIDAHPTLFRTKPPSYHSGKAEPIHHEKIKEGYNKVMPHMLPHGHYEHHEDHKIMPHMLPHGEHYDGYKSGPPPSLPSYVPPPISTTYTDGYHKLPKYLATEYDLPPKQYLPSHHRLPPKEYLPTNPQIYEPGYKKPSYDSKEPNQDLLNPMQTLKPPLADFVPPSDLKAPIKADGYIPPDKATLKPPDKDYLPPADYLAPEIADDPTIPRPPSPDDIPGDIDEGLSSNRGSQFPLQQKEKEYSAPPPRPRPGSLDIVIEDILNSQVNPPIEGKEMYIPPKTKFDVPTNFIRPDDLLRAPRPGLVAFDEADLDPDYDVDEFGTIDILDGENLPEPPLPESVPEQLTEQPFLGLAKLIDPERKKSLKELEELREEVKKLAKLVEKEKPRGPQLPPIPTVPSLLSLQQLKLPPQPSSFMPFLEKLEPTVLQQLQTSVRSQNSRDGKIPGKPGVDYPDFKTIPATDFSCENFLLEGFYADTFTSCQVFHVCESGKRQSSFLCPKGTIFNQKHRVCDWWYNVKCEDATEFYDLNLDLILLDKGVSPTQTTSLNVPPPIDPFSDLGNSIDSGLLSGSDLPLELLAGSDAELDSLILDDLVLSNLLGKRRMDEGDDHDDSQFLPDVIDVTLSPISKRLPSSVAAPVQPQPKRKRKRKNGGRRRRPKGSRKESRGGGSLCQIIGICDSVPSATQEEAIKSQHLPQSDVPFAASQNKPLYIEAPKEKRIGEKTAAEIAQLFLDDEPMRSEEMDDSQFAGSSISNSFSFPLPLEHSFEPENPAEINFNDGKQITIEDDIPEGHRMTHFGKDVTQLDDFLNVPISSINFEDYKERESRMVPESKDESIDEQSEFKLEDHNVDREARTWRPLRVNKSGEVERTDVSESLDESDWVPKLGPDVKVRET